tara:strand:- start:1625 stop:1789 length:165 start_codon:yes stop_codon:yes gene_type:complete
MELKVLKKRYEVVDNLNQDIVKADYFAACGSRVLVVELRGQFPVPATLQQLGSN